MSADSTVEVGLEPYWSNHGIRMTLTDMEIGQPVDNVQAGVEDSKLFSSTETVNATTDGTYTSGVLNTNAGDIDFWFEIDGSEVDTGLQLGESAQALGWQITYSDGFSARAELNDVPNTGDFFMAVSLEGDSPQLQAQLYDNQDLLDLAATGEPGWHDVLADGVQANYARTGTWYIGAVPDDEPGPSSPTNWDALAAEAQARFEATGQWGLLSYDAADSEWGLL